MSPNDPSIQNRYFTEFTWTKGFLYSIAVLFVLATVTVVLYQPYIELPCSNHNVTQLDFLNVQYVYDPCHHERYPHLLGFTVVECYYVRRILASVFFGGMIGWERKTADRPAGIRTMSLVSLGSCLFTLCSTFAFLSGPMEWDASRVSAAIPSGVGFLGSALIFKQRTDDSHIVHGLTTATSVWLSAAVGIACGGGMYFVASLCTAFVLVVLRFAPRAFDPFTDEDEDMEEEQTPAASPSAVTFQEQGRGSAQSQRLKKRDLARLLPNLAG